MTRPIVLVSNLMMLNEKDRFNSELRKIGCEPLWPEVKQFLTEEQCLSWAGKIDAWLAGDDVISRAVLKAHQSRLKGISKWGTGVDSIDLEAAKELNIPLKNTPGAFGHAVAEVAIGYMLMLTRGLNTVDQQVRNGYWPKPQGSGLFGKKIGIIGFGAIGQQIAKRSISFGMEVLYFDTNQEFSVDLEARKLSIDDLLELSDIVCLACNFTPSNRHLINDQSFKKMKDSALLINVARGPLVDEIALIKALDGNLIAGAGLDVFETEPLPTENPFNAMANVILGSHNANNQTAAVEHVHLNTLKNLQLILNM